MLSLGFVRILKAQPGNQSSSAFAHDSLYESIHQTYFSHSSRKFIEETLVNLSLSKSQLFQLRD